MNRDDLDARHAAVIRRHWRDLVVVVLLAITACTPLNSQPKPCPTPGTPAATQNCP
jgi:hypothetical protein